MAGVPKLPGETELFPDGKGGWSESRAVSRVSSPGRSSAKQLPAPKAVTVIDGKRKRTMADVETVVSRNYGDPPPAWNSDESGRPVPSEDNGWNDTPYAWINDMLKIAVGLVLLSILLSAYGLIK